MKPAFLAAIAGFYLLTPFPALGGPDFEGVHTGQAESAGRIVLRLFSDGEGGYEGILEMGGRKLAVYGFLDGEDMIGDIGGDEDGDGPGFIFRLSRRAGKLHLQLLSEDEDGEPVKSTLQEIVLETGESTPSKGERIPVETEKGDPSADEEPSSGKREKADEGAGWSGEYVAQVQGQEAVLVLSEARGTVEGSLNLGGVPYQIAGKAARGEATGTLTDPRTGETAAFRAGLEKGTILFVLLIVDPASKETREVPVTFAPRQVRETEAPAGAGHSEKAVERDPALVGAWRHTESYTGGDFSMATETHLDVYPDGTYVLGGSQVAGGGNAGSFDSGAPGEGTRGEWKTGNQVVFVRDPGAPQWVAYARYYVEGNSMMFTFENGSRKMWERR